MDRAQLARWIEEGLSLDAMAAKIERHPSTVSYWINKHGLQAVGASVHGPKGGIEKSELKELIDAEVTIGDIAERLGASSSNVRYWIRRYGLDRERIERRAAIRQARGRGDAEIELRCRSHGPTRHYRHGAYFRCAKCRSEGVSRRRRKVKQSLVDEAGGRCARCGYDRAIEALQFHHLVPESKEFALSGRGVTRSLASARVEANKCALLCANCHAEVEAGVTELS